MAKKAVKKKPVEKGCVKCGKTNEDLRFGYCYGCVFPKKKKIIK